VKALKFHIPQPFERDFSVTLHLTQEGVFTTTLPPEIASLMLDHGCELEKNRLGNYGYFESTTFEGIRTAISAQITALCSEKLISETRVLLYEIGTHVSYCLDSIDGGIYPNGYYMPIDVYRSKSTSWREGTHRTSSPSDCHPFSLSVYVAPYIREEYEYLTGKRRVAYNRFPRPDIAAHGEDPWLWLAGLGHMGPEESFYLDRDRSQRLPRGVSEIEYTEEVGHFFVNLIKGLCMLNERIKPFLTPDTIQALISGGMGLLSAPQSKKGDG